MVPLLYPPYDAQLHDICPICENSGWVGVVIASVGGMAAGGYVAWDLVEER